MPRLKSASSSVKSVSVDNKTYLRLKKYSLLTGLPMKQFVSEVLNEWMDIAGELHLEALDNESEPSVELIPRRYNVVSIDSVSSFKRAING